MQLPIWPCRAIAVSAVASFFVASFSVRAATINWTNSAGGGWSTAANWNPNGVPGTNDTAIITNAGNYSVTLDVNPTVVGLELGASSGSTTQSFFMGGRTLTVNGPIQVNSQGQFNLNGGALAGTNVLMGTLTWSGGAMSGVMTLPGASVLNIVAGGGDGFNGLVLTNYGTVNWTNTTLYGILGHNAQIYNYGLWNAQSDNLFQGGYQGGTTLFDNFGTFRKSGLTGVTTLDSGIVFNNTGTLDSQLGNISLQGTYTLANGTKMSFGLNGPTNNGQISLSGVASFAGSLSVNLNGSFSPTVGSAFNLLHYTSESGVLFTNTALPALIAWQTNYNPTVFILSVGASSTNPAPTNLTITTLNGTNLELQWPADHTGWRIQGQTNAVAVGLTTNWVTIPGSGLTNQIILPIDKANGSVFFRMIYP
jgi:hypothetical protein